MRVGTYTRRSNKDIIVDSLKYSQQNKGLEIFAFVAMTKHIHLS
jgi:putative transposase